MEEELIYFLCDIRLNHICML